MISARKVKLDPISSDACGRFVDRPLIQAFATRYVTRFVWCC
jgi:hypothetical protein